MNWRQARESAKLAFVVTPLLVAINHYDELARGHWSGLGLKATLTFLMPFAVSLYSAKAALREAGGRAGCRPFPQSRESDR